MRLELKKTHQKILNANNILLTTHTNPDGDAYGCLASLIYYFDSIQQTPTIFIDDSLKSNFDFLNVNQRIITDHNLINHQNFDLIIILDSGDLEHTRLFFCHPEQGKQNTTADKEPRESIKPVIINIDHHQSNTLFGDLNIVDPNRSSTTEILYEFFKINKITITPDIATALLLGIMTDTEKFQTSSTTSHSQIIASQLLKSGAKLNLINQNIFQNKTLQELKLFGQALSDLRYNPKYKIAYTYINHDHNLPDLSNFLQNIEGTKITLILKQITPGIIKGSLRTTDPQIDLSRLARIFGGGGHPQAAGFTLTGRLIQTNNRLCIE